MIELAAATGKSASAWDQPGTLAFLVVFGMAIILFFVFRSLGKHLRKINEAARREAAGGEPMKAGTGRTGTGPGSDGPVGPPSVNGAGPTF